MTWPAPATAYCPQLRHGRATPAARPDEALQRRRPPGRSSTTQWTAPWSSRASAFSSSLEIETRRTFSFPSVRSQTARWSGGRHPREGSTPPSGPARRLSEGELHAEEGIVTWACHGSLFDLETGAASAPAHDLSIAPGIGRRRPLPGSRRRPGAIRTPLRAEPPIGARPGRRRAGRSCEGRTATGRRPSSPISSSARSTARSTARAIGTACSLSRGGSGALLWIASSTRGLTCPWSASFDTRS